MTDIDGIIAGMSEAEKSRLIHGRHDWRDDDWQDHCGDPNCEHCDGATWDQHISPNWLSDTDKAVRARLEASNG